MSSAVHRSGTNKRLAAVGDADTEDGVQAGLCGHEEA